MRRARSNCTGDRASSLSTPSPRALRAVVDTHRMYRCDAPAPARCHVHWRRRNERRQRELVHVHPRCREDVLGTVTPTAPPWEWLLASERVSHLRSVARSSSTPRERLRGWTHAHSPAHAHETQRSPSETPPCSTCGCSSAQVRSGCTTRSPAHARGHQQCYTTDRPVHECTSAAIPA